ncbi:MAG TPA: TonB-dependent receptor [Candidatus Brocadiaceae bacterium]
MNLTANSQETSTTLDPVSVSASLTPMTTSKTGRNIVVIKGEKFSNLPVHSIDELLRYVPGVEVQARGPMGSQSDIVLRGGTFQQVLIILDGIRLNDPNTGHFNSYIPISPAEIDRIEILKGASSAIYGSEAVGGVINIITKTFSAKLMSSESPANAGRHGGRKKQLTVQTSAGEYGLWNINAGGFYRKGKTAISGGMLTNNADGQLQRGTRGFFKNTNASLSFSHFFNDNWQISLRSAYDKRKFSAQNFYTTYVSDTAKEKVESYWNQLQLIYKQGTNKFSLNAGYKNVSDQYAFNPRITPNKNKSQLLQAIAIYEKQFSTNSTILAGGQFQNKIIHSNDRGNHDVKQAAAFAVLNQAIGEYFAVSPALRLDWDERAGSELVPQVNLSFKKGSWQLRGSAGKTIRQADFTERYNNYNKTLVTSGSIGNPELEAERSFSYEAGVDYLLRSARNDEGGGLKISATLFRREQQKVIDWTTTPYSQMPRKDNLSPTGTYALAKNIAKVNTSGLETDVQFNGELGNQQSIWATVGVVWLDRETSDAVPSFYISSHAKLLTNFNVLYNWRWLNVSVNGIYKHRAPQSATAINAKLSGDYFVMNVKAEGFIWKKRLSVFVEADNVFDKSYSDLLGSQMPGRWLMGGVRLEIN